MKLYVLLALSLSTPPSVDTLSEGLWIGDCQDVWDFDARYGWVAWNCGDNCRRIGPSFYEDDYYVLSDGETCEVYDPIDRKCLDNIEGTCENYDDYYGICLDDAYYGDCLYYDDYYGLCFDDAYYYGGLYYDDYYNYTPQRKY